MPKKSSQIHVCNGGQRVEIVGKLPIGLFSMLIVHLYGRISDP